MGDDNREYLTFSIDTEEYGLSVLKVREVLEMAPVTRIPRMPHFMKGVINIRGSVVPVIDLRLKFDLEEIDATDNTSIIVLEIEKDDSMVLMGIIVDSVQAVISIGEDSINPPPSVGISVNTDFIFGIGDVDGKFITILDIDRIVSSGELSEITENKALPKDDNIAEPEKS